jgi:hypothetical protein
MAQMAHINAYPVLFHFHIQQAWLSPTGKVAREIERRMLTVLRSSLKRPIADFADREDYVVDEVVSPSAKPPWLRNLR